MIYCSKCGTELKDSMEFCYKCGAKVEVIGTQEYQKNRKAKELPTKKIIVLLAFTVIAVVILFCRKLLFNTVLSVQEVRKIKK